MVSKKLSFFLALLIFVVSGAISYFYFSMGGAVKVERYIKPVTSEDNMRIADGGPKTQECPMNGQKYSRGQKRKWDKRRPLGIAIENHTQARPQSGLSAADVVYEAVAEGGITRFLAIYYCEDAATVGPVRSARIYFLKLLQEYGKYPLYSHVGGANTPGPADALGEIRELGWDQYNDLNQFGVPFPYYYRDYERLPGRVTEHTMYSSTSKLWEFAAKKRKLTNVDEKSSSWDKEFGEWKFKDDASLADRGTTQKINFDFWPRFGNTYKVVWKYNKEGNVYVRENGGSPHLDKNTGKSLIAKNVIVVFADESPANDGYQGGHLLYDIVGQGDGFLFQDGQAVKITWKKPKEEKRMKFFDKEGSEVELVRGKIFIEILPTGNEVEY